jgi:hypothetical protein
MLPTVFRIGPRTETSAPKFRCRAAHATVTLGGDATTEPSSQGPREPREPPAAVKAAPAHRASYYVRFDAHQIRSESPAWEGPVFICAFASGRSDVSEHADKLMFTEDPTGGMVDYG